MTHTLSNEAYQRPKVRLATENATLTLFDEARFVCPQLTFGLSNPGH